MAGRSACLVCGRMNLCSGTAGLSIRNTDTKTSAGFPGSSKMYGVHHLYTCLLYTSKDYKLAIFFALYYVFTIICGCLSWMFSKLRILMFQIWYQVTAVIWFILAVTVIVLLIRLLRLNKLKNEVKHWKE